MSFEPLKYFDSYREAVQALVRSRIEGQQTAPVNGFEADGACSLLHALEQSLKPAGRKGPTGEKLTTLPASNRKQTKLAAS